MTAGQTCALPGCDKPPFPSPGRSMPHLTCGNLHHQLLMAARFNPTLPQHAYQQIFDSNAAERCALPSCCDPPHPGHSWCSHIHYLDWLFEFTSSLLPGQICKLPDCTRHVFVEEDGSSWQFCGWRHLQKHVMLSAMQRHHTQKENLLSAQSSVESECGNVPAVSSLLPYLREYAHTSKAPRKIKVDADFFDKHPWDVFSGQPIYLIVRCKYTTKGKRVMCTKDNYHWKQQGPRSKNGEYYLKYFTYRNRKGKQNDVFKHHEGCVFHMEEYTIDDVKDFSLVKLRKELNGSSRARKGFPAADRKHLQVDIPDTCSLNTSHPTSNPTSNEPPVDSFFWTLSPLPDYHLDFDKILEGSETGNELCSRGEAGRIGDFDEILT